MKIVINKCYGGFGLSDAGMMRYAEIKGITLYPEDASYGKTYYTVPPELRQPDIGDGFYKLPLEERIKYNITSNGERLWSGDIERDDPALVQVVEELGDESGGGYAELSVVEIPDDVIWEIEEYDGKEWVAEQHRTWS
jgi:hypothetical protein